MPALPKWFVALSFLVCWPTLVFGAPMFSTEADGIRIVLTDEPCAVKEVTNLQYRATWTEKGKVHEGCWAPRPDMGVVMSYWGSDKTVAVIPIQVFQKVVAI